ncbi:MAG: hypothetical protein H5U40_01140 [Polyangiaceae bacterium]|nr:hypothetical protein [Polyangiaceae bacterium]
MSLDPLDAALVATAALEGASIPCAIGGALALGVWGVPRATLDVDLNVFVDGERLDRAIDVLVAAGLAIETEAARAAAAADGWFSAKLSGIRVDVFVPSIPFSYEAARTRRLVCLEGRDVPFLSMEALAVFKMLFFRPKDLIDLERLLALQPDLDRRYVRAHLVDMVGETDARIPRWDELTG